ncbi:MAG: GGDEF domain-containing protein [Acidobacteria bacterium]|nr:GGDEF domain-containing protein [Acidobacteriota bacterium]
MSSPSSFAYKILAFSGLLAPGLTFLIAVSDTSMERKTVGLLLISLIYAAICVWAFLKDKEASSVKAAFVHLPAVDGGDGSEDRQIDEKLQVLGEASAFFGSTLKSEDMFRLVSSRVGEIVPFDASVLMLPDDERRRLSAAHSEGIGIDDQPTADVGIGPAGMAFLSGEIELGDTVEPSGNNDRPYAAVAALPLHHKDETFAVYQMYFSEPISDREKLLELLRPVAEKIAPLFLGAKALDESLSNALTDPLTDLPNERAFYLVLETQVAESQRFAAERPLSVVVADIKGFDDANRIFGHATGDNILRFTGETMRAILRRMDFLARSSGDEFLILLPTADERTADDIVARVREGFAATAFQLSEHESTKIWLNFGIAAFHKDGDTSQDLLQTARARKQQAKSEDPANIVWSGEEYLN